ncbi:uncharacterized protein [Cicer arietinum]|uniref:Ankyrin repeat-containing protein NPR4-like isoform X2 n=1 Tax=Cicer arietinum TaxID=3827 RepID=A0A3Q7YCG8_CICAR|nr:ankyrin repeat-containing protein NPR4-like isoform X2 [Cicer arietinum]
MASAESSPLMSSDHIDDSVIEFTREFNHRYYQPLHLSILKGDWESTKAFIDNDPTALTTKISILGRTALHVAAVSAQWHLIEKLLQHMPANVLEELDFVGWTCLHYVAMGESINAAKALIAKNPSLTQIADSKGFTPLLHSVTYNRCKEMVWYLVLNTTDDRPGCPFSGPSASQLVTLLTAAGFHDITMYLVQHYPNLATISDLNGSIILNVLSKLPSHFQSGHNFAVWKSFIYHCIPVEHEYLPPNQSIIGNTIWNALQNLGYVVQTAIKNRQEKVFSLLCKMPIICKLLVMAFNQPQNTTSHLAARFVSQVESISGASFQLQRELLWFKEVEKLNHPLYKEVKNQDGKTAWQVFKEEHKPLLEEGKNWMKDTSNSCMLVATLIATIAFAAAITVPGGNNQDRGIPIFLSDNTFMIFAVSDALALFSSMASLLMFLAILNARFAEEDFVMALPKRLIIGLACLFFGVVSTMVAFGAALSMLLQERLKWAPIPIAVLACVPIALFAKLQLPLFIEMIISTYGSRFSRIY